MPHRRRTGSIHEGGELGYALFHAYGVVFDNPALIACCFHLVVDVANQVPKLHAQDAHIKQRMRDKLTARTCCIHEYGEDMPEIRDWKWSGQGAST